MYELLNTIFYSIFFVYILCNALVQSLISGYFIVSVSDILIMPCDMALDSFMMNHFFMFSSYFLSVLNVSLYSVRIKSLTLLGKSCLCVMDMSFTAFKKFFICQMSHCYTWSGKIFMLLFKFYNSCNI